MTYEWQTRRRAGTALVLCLAAAASWVEFAPVKRLVRLPDSVPTVVNRFEELKDTLPARGTVCYLSDLDPRQYQGISYWYLVEYSLAPVVMRAGADCAQVVAQFGDPAAVRNLIESNGLEIERQYYPDLMLLRRKRP